MSRNSYRDLDVWRKSMDLVVQCYDVTRAFPANEKYGLMGQIQRAAVSVPANIAEGQAREHRKEFLHHLSIAHGSVAELETHIEIASRIGYLKADVAHRLFGQTEEVGRMINGLRRSLRQARPQKGQSND
ncbi:MAG: four helix bundle protein [Sedimentisphaerales bacterium]|nr:four helix bundle protein [Sedimentisphaerales bacterium]NLT77473.1 four helix bundle protein [Planctomycetota bacterium]